MKAQPQDVSEAGDTVLIKPLGDVTNFLQKRIDSGHKIYRRKNTSEAMLEKCRLAKTSWHESNIEYLKSCFNTDIIAKKGVVY